jgi:hypothetical protein
MSLINDALKRVSEAERGKPAAQTDFATASLQPAPYERRTSPLIWIAIPVVVAAIGIGGYLLTKQKQQTQPAAVSIVTTQPQPADAATPLAVTTARSSPTATTSPAPAAIIAPVAEPVSNSPVSPNSQSANRNPQSDSLSRPEPAAQAAPTPAQPAPATAPSVPTFRLKGILYTKNPTALINDASVHVGGEIDGATVTKIESTTVTLDYQGKPTILKLGIRQ